jgi:hypothetical protein
MVVSITTHLREFEAIYKLDLSNFIINEILSNKIVHEYH